MADETKIPGTVEEPAPPEAAAPETPGGPPAPEQLEQEAIPGMGEENPAPAGKVSDLSDVRAAGSEKSDARQEWEIPIAELEAQQQKPKRGRAPKAKTEDKGDPGKADKPPAKGKRTTPAKGAPSAPGKAGRPKKAPEKPAPAKEEAPPPEPPQPRDATRAEKEEIVYLNLSDLHPFRDHPFGVRDDAEMQGLVESVRSGGVNQPALVRPP